MSKVLYLDDTSDQRQLVETILATIGVQVETATDGDDGLRKMQQARPDLVLLDLRMPKLNGLEFLKIVKNRPETKDIPIVVISAWANRAARDEALAAGAVDFLIKPYDLDDLVAMVQQHLPR